MTPACGSLCLNLFLFFQGLSQILGSDMYTNINLNFIKLKTKQNHNVLVREIVCCYCCIFTFISLLNFAASKHVFVLWILYR